MSELMHYGRKGMKWYQHIFGEIDARGKYAAAKVKQASKDALDKMREREAAAKVRKQDQANVSSKRKLSEVPDEELRKRVERLRLEQEYRRLVTDKKKEMSKGQKAVFDILTEAGKRGAAAFASVAGTNLAKVMQENQNASKKRKEDKEKAEAEKRAQREKERKANKASKEYGTRKWLN